jgi:hypothetical protein
MSKDMPYGGTTFTIDTRDSEFFYEVVNKDASDHTPSIFFGRKWLLDESSWETSQMRFHGKITFRRLEEVRTESAERKP